MRNPIAIVIADEAPAPRGHPLRFGVIKSVHRSTEMAYRAYLASPSAWCVELVVEAKPGERIRIDHLRELVVTRMAP